MSKQFNKLNYAQPTQPTTILFEKKRALEEAKEGLTAQKELSEQQKKEFEKRKEEIKLQREQLIQRPAMYDHYVKQSYDKIAQAEQLYLSEQSTCKTLDKEIQAKQRKIAELEAERKKKERKLAQMEKSRDYLIHEETDEFPEVSIENIQKQQEETLLEIGKTKQELGNAILAMTNQLDVLESQLKDKRATVRAMSEGIQTEVVQLAASKAEESEAKMALANLFTRVVIARVQLAGTLSAPAIVQAYTLTSSSPPLRSTTSATGAQQSLSAPSALGSYLSGTSPSSPSYSSGATDSAALIAQLQHQAFLQQQQHEADLIIEQMKEANGVKTNDEAMLCLIRDFLIDLSACEKDIDRLIAEKQQQALQSSISGAVPGASGLTATTAGGVQGFDATRGADLASTGVPLDTSIASGDSASVGARNKTPLQTKRTITKSPLSGMTKAKAKQSAAPSATPTSRPSSTGGMKASDKTTKTAAKTAQKASPKAVAKAKRPAVRPGLESTIGEEAFWGTGDM
eukprot:MONOS_11289.1-p1 / transcript=MONOS_11289.1 / gene=MONOS_11289 / organism=Monocercomonoides_exilis_PA203 / gene_product=unspecified product / transcript_product=unspecified product / location=Mono_scaffold00559:9762-11711(+) / protein_length=513 / sequence_SO=supercontig / SO=protein_coding / is_pseudo=false